MRQNRQNYCGNCVQHFADSDENGDGMRALRNAVAKVV